MARGAAASTGPLTSASDEVRKRPEEGMANVCARIADPVKFEARAINGDLASIEGAAEGIPRPDQGDAQKLPRTPALSCVPYVVTW